MKPKTLALGAVAHLVLVRSMRARLLISLFLLGCGVADAEDFDTWWSASPDKKLFAIERRVPNSDEPTRLDLDGFVLYICKASSVATPEEIIAQHRFAGRLVSQVRWSPDSNFLLFTTSSSGGHSPWHFRTFVFCTADKSFRDVEDAVGDSVVEAEFDFEFPNIATLTVRDPAGDDRTTAVPSKQLKLPLAEAMKKMKKVK